MTAVLDDAEWQWQPDPDAELLPPDVPVQRCPRRLTALGATCGRLGVWRLVADGGRPVGQQRHWCERCTFTRRIVDGRVEVRVLREAP